MDIEMEFWSPKGNAPRMRKLQGKLEQKIAKLETHLEHFPSDAVHLQVNLERHPKRVWFDAALTLPAAPRTSCRVEKSGPDPLPVLDQAIKALLARGGGPQVRLCGTRATIKRVASRKA